MGEGEKVPKGWERQEARAIELQPYLNEQCEVKGRNEEKGVACGRDDWKPRSCGEAGRGALWRG